MINKLTEEQEKLIPIIRDQWIDFCLGGDTSINKSVCESGINWLYSLAKLKNPTFICCADGPIAAQLIANGFPEYLKHFRYKEDVVNSVGNSVRNSVENSVVNSVWNSVENSVWNSVENSVGKSVGHSVWNSVENSVWNSVEKSVGYYVVNSVWNSVRNSVENSVWNSVENSVGKSVGHSVWNSVWDSVRNSVEKSVVNSVWNSVENSVWNSVGNSVRNSVEKSVEKSVGESSGKYERPFCGVGWWAGWFAFYDFFDQIGISTDNYIKFKDWAKSGPWDILCFEGLCIITCRPSVIKKNNLDRLHCETGPAAEWPSGEKYWFLNGINVPEWLVMTDAGKIDPRKALEEKNVDVQREIIRKVGAERMLKACDAKVLDIFIDKHTKGGNEYKLMSMKFGSIDRKYLYFEHASFPGVYYAQPVHPGLKKALHARAWMLGVGELEELNNMRDFEIRKCLPVEVA